MLRSLGNGPDRTRQMEEDEYLLDWMGKQTKKQQIYSVYKYI